MKEYIQRLKDNCPKRRFAFWWIFRLLMIYAFVAGFFKKPFDITDPLQVGANLVAMFSWEILMFCSPKRVFHYMPSVVQTFSILIVFAASFCGKFLNFYYDIRLWDAALHFLGGAGCVFLGYELACALIKRDKKDASLSMILLAAVGFSFIGSTAWELFEFTFDQVAGMMSGYPGDSQHWSLLIALDTAKAVTLFDPIVPERWPIMDIMGDIVLNTVGALVSYIFLKFVPYRHRGRFSFDFNFEKEKETANV